MAAALDPEEILRSTRGKDNFQRITQLLISGGTSLLREIFDSICPPSSLPTILSNPVTKKRLKAAKLTMPQWHCLCPSPGVYGKSADFDITLLLRLLRTICNLTPPITGWDALPAITDHSLEADIARVKYYRNSVYGQVNQGMTIRDSEFLTLWQEISEALVRIAGRISSTRKTAWQEAIDKYLTDPLTTEDERNVQELKAWYKKDMEIKKAIEEVHERMNLLEVAAMAAKQPSDKHKKCRNLNVMVLKTSDVEIRGNDVFMPLKSEMTLIKKAERGQFKNIQISDEMTERDVTETLLETFPYLRNQRFYCAAVADDGTRLDFKGDRRIWNVRLINGLLRGNAVLYIFVDEQVPGYANMAPQSEASSRTAVRTATQNQVDLDATLVTSSRSLPIGSIIREATSASASPNQWDNDCAGTFNFEQKKFTLGSLVKHMPFALRTKIERMMNINNHNDHNWRGLAAAMNLSVDEVRQMEEGENGKMTELFDRMIHTKRTIKDFLDFLKHPAVQRLDVIDEIVERCGLPKEVSENESSELDETDPELKRQLQFDGCFLHPEKYNPVKFLGSGGFAKVYLVIEKRTGKKMAAKMFDLGANTTDTQQLSASLDIEVRTLTSLKHERIVEFFFVERIRNTFLLFLEYMEGGSLEDLLRNNGPLEEPLVVKFTRQLLCAVDFLHANGKKSIVHKDIKGRKILLDGAHKNIKLVNFGIFAIMGELRTFTGGLVTKNNVASFHWASPELLAGEEFGRKTDIWSVGCTVVEMLTTKPPLFFEELSVMEKMWRIINHLIEPPADCTPLAFGFLERCLCPKEIRASAAELLSDPFLNHEQLEEVHPQGVPLDIQARGPLATEVYNRELKEGQGYARRVPIMIIGQARTGKTSLKKSLKGELFDPDEGRTKGIETDPSYFKVTTDIWRTGRNSEDTKTEPEFLLDRQLAQNIFKGLKEEELLGDPSTSGTKPSVNDSKEVEPSEANSPPTERSEESSSNRFEPSPQGSKVVKFSVEPEELKTSSSVTEQSESDPSPQDSKDHQKVPENVAAWVEKLLKENKEFMEGDDMYSVIWDFGGQSVFYDTHPIFLTEKAIYILTCDLSCDPYKPADAPVKHGMYENIEDTDCQKTNFDYLDFWMSSIYSLVSNNTNRQETSSSETFPAVFLACTHADKPYTKTGNPSRKIFGALREIYGSLLKDVFLVDNTKAGSNDECEGVKGLREKVRFVAAKLLQNEQKIPLKWLRYEKVLYLMRKEGREKISIEDARKIASDKCGIDGEENLRTALNFLHDQKVLINFDESPGLERMVILNPQWLVDVFKEVITFKGFNHNDENVEGLWREFEESGILKRELLDYVWKRFIDDQNTCESLIEMMEKFSLLCQWPSEENTERYLVPSMLKSKPTSKFPNPGVETPSLFVKFKSRRVPPGGVPQGREPPGRVPPGGVPQGREPPGGVPQGRDPPGRVPPGGMPQGREPPGRVPPGGVPQGRDPPGRVPPGLF